MKKKIKREGKFYVYILECKDGTYYTGYTNDLERRIDEHNNNRSRGAKYLRGKLPVKLVYAKEYRYYKRAVRREREIKTFTRAEKENLIRIYEKSR
ncbi:MAG: GIY-YIG nuclease family protein [Candidatus Omnitrophota bacterium]